VTCSSARSPSGFEKRWASRDVTVHRLQRADYGIPHATACRALGVSQAWFYKWHHGDPSPRHARRVALTTEIKRLFARYKGKYGSPRITTDLTEAG
jgi:putative transposase